MFVGNCGSATCFPGAMIQLCCSMSSWGVIGHHLTVENPVNLGDSSIESGPKRASLGPGPFPSSHQLDFPETNSQFASENRPGPNGKLIFQSLVFQGLCLSDSGRVLYLPQQNKITSRCKVVPTVHSLLQVKMKACQNVRRNVGKVCISQVGYRGTPERSAKLQIQNVI